MVDLPLAGGFEYEYIIFFQIGWFNHQLELYLEDDFYGINGSVR